VRGSTVVQLQADCLHLKRRACHGQERPHFQQATDVSVLALIIGALAVANTMLAALERRRELALLTAFGWSGSQLAAPCSARRSP
jgi:hypothetical protein